MSALRDRLRGLRAQAGHSVAAAAPVPAPRKTTTEDLRWLLGVRARSQARPTTPFPARDRELFGEEIAPGLRYTEEHVDWPGPPAPIDTRFARREEMIDPARLLHFDTETPGLAGGTGTRAFMIGAADWLGGRLRLRQLTITTMAAEPAMLRTFAEWLSPDSVLVSYNGKCYDAPLLATRYRLARLATAERQLLGVLREDDLPGSEAPAAWLTYLRGGPATNLRRVAAHNAQDLKSLAGVLLRLSALGGVAACEPS